MASSVDDARERAETAFRIAELKSADLWAAWPHEIPNGESGMMPWRRAGIAYIHEILPAEAEIAVSQVSSSLYFEAYLFDRVIKLAQDVSRRKLQRWDDYFRGFWPVGTADSAVRAFVEAAVKESRNLIESLVAKHTPALGRAIEPPPPASQPAEPASAVPVPSEPVSVKQRVSQNLKRLRANRGWSLEELANASGVNRKLLIRSEKHGKGFHPGTKKKLADALGISVEDLEK